MFKHILMPTDGSPLAYKAIRAGMDFAIETGARVTGYHALPTSYVPADDLDREMHAPYENRTREQGETYVDIVAKAARERSVTCEVVLDAPETAYAGIVAVAQARGCDLIFMASHGRTGGPVQILGSIAQKVVALSSIPVLVYRTP
jgi:nucleotide-binding universal stress UspA family protein